MAMTWTSLLAELDVILGRDPATDDDYAAARPGMVERGERRIAAKLNLSLFNHTSTGTMTVGSNSVARPEALIAGISFEIQLASGAWKGLIWRPISWLREWWSTPDATGEPRYIAVLNDAGFEVAPPPDLAYPWRYVYRKHAGELLSDSNPTNELTANHPNLLLYACAIEGAVWAQEDRRDALKASYLEQFTDLIATVVANEQSLGLPEFQSGENIGQEPKS